MSSNRHRRTVERILQRMGRHLWDETPPVGTHQGAFTRARLSDHLSVRHYDDVHEIYYMHDTVGFVLELTPLLGADDTTGRILTELFTNALPPGAWCQVINWAGPKIGDTVDQWALARRDAAMIYRQLAAERREHYRRGAFHSASKNAPFHFRDFRIFVTVELEGEIDQYLIDQLKEIRSKFVASFSTIRAYATILHPAQLIGFLTDVLNPTRTIRPSNPVYDPHRYISEQVVRSDTRWTRFRDRIVIEARGVGDQLDATDWQREMKARDDTFEMRGFSVARFPPHWTQAYMSRVLGDAFNDQLRLVGSTLTTLVFKSRTVAETKTTTEFSRMRSDQAASNPLTKAFPAVRRKAEDWAMVAEDVAEGALLADLGMFVVSIAPVEDSERAERALRSIWNGARFELARDDDIHIQTVLACLPLSLGGGLFEDLKTFDRLKLMPTSVVSRLAPMQGEDAGDARIPHMLLAGRRGQIMLWSSYSTDGGNYNTTVTGSSGSGKSVFMQDLVVCYRSAGVEVFVIDDGRSFQNMCTLLGGTNIRFTQELEVCLNPFSLVDYDLALEDSDYTIEARKNIVYQVLTMCRGAREPSPEEEGAIDLAVGMVWERKGSDGCIDDVRDVLQGKWREDPAPGQVGDPPFADFGGRGANLALALTPYTTQGSYGAFFNGPATLDITNPMTVFEMGDLESKPDLRAVIMLAVMSIVRQRMKKGGRSIRKALIIDEAWALLSDGAMGKFIEGFARRCRKEGGALITGTQSIDDYYATAGANACLQNSDWQIFLRLKDSAIASAARDQKVNLDDGDMSMLKSLRTSAGEFSELLIKGPAGAAVARLCLDPFSATLYSTTPAVFTAIEHWRAQGLALSDAVARVAFGAPDQKKAS